MHRPQLVTGGFFLVGHGKVLRVLLAGIGVVALLGTVVIGVHLATTEPAGTPTTIAPLGRPPVVMDLGGVKLVSVVPVRGGWASMWEHWDLATLDRDFGRIAALHANAVRIIIQPSAFGWPKPDPVMVARLGAAVASAQSHGLKVQLTLFDEWGGYADLAASSSWATAVLDPYRNDPEIAFVELRNEVDPTDADVMRWVRSELPVVKDLAGSVPVTVSVTGPDTPAVLTALKTALGPVQPDFYDVHYYGNPSDAYAELAEDKAIASPSPLFVGEVGMSTAPVPGQTEALVESSQDMFLRSVEWATETLGLPDAAPWMLQDLAPGANPSEGQTASDQSQYGLLRLDGSEKPAAVSMAQFFSTGVVGTQFNGSFAEESGGQPLDWAPYDATQGSLTWDGQVSHSGAGSVSLSNTSGSPGAVPAYETSPIIVPTHPGQIFRATAWATGSAATGSNRIAISWFDADRVYLGDTESAHLPSGTTPWTQLTVTSTAPPGAAYEEVHLKSSDNTGTVWFDDVTFSALN